ncbi:uncharacterized protein LOC130635374 isoform X1 [Hydractinia symbiolongicarpus]|uniref:uncharacterized protein LOC130635374 isoform X1 n=1 Tax=Hydractinia symbiolongicarpus TaxID=13093 RepID=UPI00254CD3DB|nr:uncharacterized protein LOC130635374 isoform X1 [Hydractinia symbiolongicarpus]
MRKYQIYVICFVVLAFAAATATRVCSNRNILCSVVRSTSCSKKIVSSHCPRLCNTCGAKCRNIKASMRVDCGYHGISPLDCLRKGCCYGELKVAGPWCYHRKGKFSTMFSALTLTIWATNYFSKYSSKLSHD